ncbi:MAG: hypothetical protein ACLQU4_03900 [Limisphaerales bacterium]
MKQKLFTKAIQRGLWMGALLLSAATASAASTLNFQVNMSNMTIPPGDTVSVNGAFDGWSANHTLTTTDNITYTGSVQNTSVSPGQGIDYQYRLVEANGYVDDYSSQADGDNYCVTAPANGGTANLPLQYWSDDGSPVENSITFQVDMAEQLSTGAFAIGQPVYAEGSFEGAGWDQTFQLTEGTPVLDEYDNIISLPYTGTYTTWNASPGAAAEFKYTFVNGSGTQWDSPTTGDPDNGGNRFLLNTAQTLPLVNFSDIPYVPPITVTFNFQVDMSVQIALGNFTPDTCSVTVAGDWPSYTDLSEWNASGPAMTPLESNPNIYTYSITLNGPPSYQAAQFKYVIEACGANGADWEAPSAANQYLNDGNRWVNFPATAGTVTIPTVYFSDDSFADVTTTPCMVTFTVDMTPALPGGPLAGGINGGEGFTPGYDWVVFNGIQGGVDGSWYAWDGAPTMTQVSPPNGTIYTYTAAVNAGQPFDLQYKYGVDSEDNEAPSGNNHFRYIRIVSNSGLGYIMPTDSFGNSENGSTYELSMGNLAISPAPDNSVKVSWLGRPAVELQSTTSLAPPITWTPLPATDGNVLTVEQGNELDVAAGAALTVPNVSTTFTIGDTPTFYELVAPQ